jgi:hypothetical protein
MARYRLFVFSNPLPGREEEYHQWYDEQHVPQALELKGFKAGQRFRYATSGNPPRPPFGQADPPQRYLMLWDIESDDLDSVWADLQDAMANRFTGGQPLTDVEIWLWEELTDRVEEES